MKVPFGESSVHGSSNAGRHFVVFLCRLCFFMLPRNEAFFVPFVEQEPAGVPNVHLETVLVAVEGGRLEAFLLDPSRIRRVLVNFSLAELTVITFRDGERMTRKTQMLREKRLAGVHEVLSIRVSQIPPRFRALQRRQIRGIPRLSNIINGQSYIVHANESLQYPAGIGVEAQLGPENDVR